MKNKRTVLAWAVYDLANTVFAINIITLYFALWVTVDMGGRDIYYGVTMAGSMVLVALAQPVLGAISDRYGRRMPFLISFTLLSVVFTGLLGFTGKLWTGLLFFAVANIGYQMAIVFYNTLMPEICRKEEFGKVSGIGIALGYVGTFAGLLLVRPFVVQWGRQAAFLPTAAFFLVFSLPCFFLVKDTAVPKPGAEKPGFGSALRSIKQTLSNSKKYPGLFRFVIANFIYLNAINTTMMFVAVYGSKVMQFSDGDLHKFFLFSTAFAVAGSILAGRITDRFGAKKTLVWVIRLWCLTFILVAVAFNKWIFWFIGPVSGIAMGSTWVASRALVAHLAPAEKRGEIFGFFGLSGRASAVLGPIVWGAVVFFLEPLGVLKYRIAILSLLAFSLVGLAILKKVPEPTGGKPEG